MLDEILEYEIDENQIVSRRWHRTTNQSIADVLELFAGQGLNSTEIQVITGCPKNTIDRWISCHYFGFRGIDKQIIKLTSKV